MRAGTGCALRPGLLAPENSGIGVKMRDRGYGVFLMIGLLTGLAVGLAIGEPSAGTVVGLGAGALLALGLRLRRG